jgi:hypothetical protein
MHDYLSKTINMINSYTNKVIFNKLVYHITDYNMYNSYNLNTINLLQNHQNKYISGASF